MPRMKESNCGNSNPRSRHSGPSLSSHDNAISQSTRKSSSSKKPEQKMDEQQHTPSSEHQTAKSTENKVENTTMEESVRRSGRQRMVSSRLQDAHFLYSSPKQAKKRASSVGIEEPAEKSKDEPVKKPRSKLDNTPRKSASEDIIKACSMKTEGTKRTVKTEATDNKLLKSTTTFKTPTKDVDTDGEFLKTAPGSSNSPTQLENVASKIAVSEIKNEESVGKGSEGQKIEHILEEDNTKSQVGMIEGFSKKDGNVEQIKATRNISGMSANITKEKQGGPINTSLTKGSPGVKTIVHGSQAQSTRTVGQIKIIHDEQKSNDEEAKTNEKATKMNDVRSTRIQGTSQKHSGQKVLEQVDHKVSKSIKSEEITTLVKNVIVTKSESSEVKTDYHVKQTASTPSISIKTVNTASQEETLLQEQQGAAKVVMHLPGGVIHLSEEQGVDVDLVKLLEKGNAQVTEVQQLPGGMVCYAVQEPEEDVEVADQDPENEKMAAVNSLQAITVPGTDKLGLLGPVLNLEGLLECPYCEYTTDKKANWYKHKKRHSGIRRYECDKCSYKAATSSNLKRHYAIHMDVRQFMCDICKKLFRQKIHLERHIKYKHEMKQIKCSMCSYVCSNYTPDLKMHMKRQHELCGDPSNHEYLACKQCGFIGNRRKDLRQHMKFHRPGPEVKFFCEHCSFITDCESRLGRHMLTHTQEKPFACGLCNYKGSQREHVVRHMISVHKVQPEKSAKARKRKADDMECFTEVPNPEDDTRESDTAVDALTTDDENHADGISEAVKHTTQEITAESPTTKLTIATTEAEDSEKSQPNLNETIEADDLEVDEPSSESFEKESKRESFTEIAIKVTVKQSTERNIKSDHKVSKEAGSETSFRQENEKSIANSIKEEPKTDAVNQSPSVRSQEVLPIINQQKEHSIFSRKVRLPATYTNPNREKLFACMHCTMKFAKAINLYKHLKIQHKDMQPVEEGYYGCVLCEYKSSKRKNLLVHLRKHNVWPHETPEYYYPQRVYSCLLCDYKDPVRKRLYDHWKKHHKLQIVLRPNGTAKCIMSDKGNGEMEVTELDEDNEGPLQIEIGGEVQQHQLVIPAGAAEQLGAPGVTVMQVPSEAQVTDGRLSSMVYVPSTGDQGVSDPNSAGATAHKTVMLMMEPGMAPTPVQINIPGHSSTNSTTPSEADLLTDAAESLQALAGVVESAAAVEPITAAELLEQTQQVINGSENQTESSEQPDTDNGENQNVTETRANSEVHLTSEQLMNLEAGDYIEINGETYKVEFQMDSQST